MRAYVPSHMEFLARFCMLTPKVVVVLALLVCSTSYGLNESINVMADEVFGRKILDILLRASQIDNRFVNLTLVNSNELLSALLAPNVFSLYNVIIGDKSVVARRLSGEQNTATLSGFNDTVSLCMRLQEDQKPFVPDAQVYGTGALALLVKTNPIVMGDAQSSSWGAATRRFLDSLPLHGSGYYTYVRNTDELIAHVYNKVSFFAIAPTAVCSVMQSMHTNRDLQQSRNVPVNYGIADVNNLLSLEAVALFNPGMEEFVDTLNILSLQAFGESPI